MMVGRRVTVDPDGFLARSKSRYSIRESGLDQMTARLGAVVTAVEKGDASRGTLRYAGLEKREEFAVPAHHVVHDIPPGADDAFPDGAVRHWYFHPDSGRLLLMHADDPKGEFLEYYLFERFVANPTLDDKDFDPDVLWPSKKSAKRAPRKGAGPSARTAEAPRQLPK